MAREKTFNFIPEMQFPDTRSKEKDPVVTATITTAKNLIFSKGAIDSLDLNGKTIKLFADPQKKAIAWAEPDGGFLGIQEIKGHHRLKANKSGTITLGVARLLASMGITDVTESYKKLKIQKWYDQMEKQTYYYIVVRKRSE